MSQSVSISLILPYFCGYSLRTNFQSSDHATVLVSSHKAVVNRLQMQIDYQTQIEEQLREEIERFKEEMRDLRLRCHKLKTDEACSTMC
jgi:hypothetical protein